MYTVVHCRTEIQYRRERISVSVVTRRRLPPVRTFSTRRTNFSLFPVRVRVEVRVPSPHNGFSCDRDFGAWAPLASNYETWPKVVGIPLTIRKYSSIWDTAQGNTSSLTRDT